MTTHDDLVRRAATWLRTRGRCTLVFAEMVELINETERRNIKAARESSAAFVEYVMTSELDGSELTNADFHREWHETVRDNAWSLFICPIGHAKTTHIAIGYVLWSLGRNRSIRIAKRAPARTLSLEAQLDEQLMLVAAVRRYSMGTQFELKTGRWESLEARMTRERDASAR